jgi:hypothetical protein
MKRQDKATKIYQDNEAAIQVMKNRGSLSKHSRHIKRRVLAARNKVEDGETWPEYVYTDMLADLGTKALADGQFVYLRDWMNGYALVKLHHPSYALPPYVSRGKKYNGIQTLRPKAKTLDRRSHAEKDENKGFWVQARC